MNSEYRAAMRWMADDDTGASSTAIVCAALNIPYQSIFARDARPYDPDDLGRCLRMLKRMPWAKRGIDRLARHNKTWRSLRKHWSELSDLMAEEVGIRWEKARNAPRTYARMQEVIGEAA
jgi:hypothetical protein